jgi:hypothetical protein
MWKSLLQSPDIESRDMRVFAKNIVLALLWNNRTHFTGYHRMEAVFIEIAKKSGTSFRLGEMVAPAVSAMRSKDVARDLISLGTITMSQASPGIFENTDASDGAPLMGILFDYAIEVAPRVEGEDNIIDVAGLSAHVEFMRDTFGDVEISPEIIVKIGQLAQMNVNLDSLAERDAPGSNGDAG